MEEEIVEEEIVETENQQTNEEEEDDDDEKKLPPLPVELIAPTQMTMSLARIPAWNSLTTVLQEKFFQGAMMLFMPAPPTPLQIETAQAFASVMSSDIAAAICNCVYGIVKQGQVIGVNTGVVTGGCIAGPYPGTITGASTNTFKGLELKIT